MRVRQLYLCVLFVNVLLICRGVSGEVKNGDLEDFTNSVFKDKNGIIAAYGDFNADQNTDVFVIHPASTQQDEIPKMSILIWHNVEPYLKHQPNLVLNLTRRTGEVITSVVPGDYDGDSKMDVLLTTKNATSMYDKSAPTAVLIYWGNLNSFYSAVPTVVSEAMADQPLVMDYNADMIADIFGATAAGTRTLWIQSSSGSRNFTEIPVLTKEGNLIKNPHSNAFLDLDSDFITDIFLTSSSSEHEYLFEVWKNLVSSDYKLNETYYLPKGNFSIVGQSAFTDVDADGILEQLLPVCFDEHCRRSAIYVRKDRKWAQEPIINFEHVPIHDEVMGFVPPGPDVTKYAVIPITLSVGDYNTDRYPDLMIVMRNKNDSRRAVLLNNNEGVSFSPVARMGALWTITNPVIATFVDLSQSTMLDMFVVSQTNPSSPPMMHAVKNNFIVDAYFIRVQVLSGLCFYSCPGFASGTYPYGVNQPGPTVHYETTGTSGKKEYSKGAQLSQSAYYSLQLPSVFMGLGQNPNFVDVVTVGIPTNDTIPRIKEWNSIIPNSILIVIPEPPTKPSAWDVKLLITPGQSVYLTAGALLGTCLFVAFIVGLLHLKERREDEKEKRQESHRFHFDAM